jgi:hypothetical protein
MKKYNALILVIMLISLSGCLNEIPMENATIVITNTGTYIIDTIRIFDNMSSDRSLDNMLKTGEFMQNYMPDNVKSFTVMAGISYYVEVHYQGGTSPYLTQKTAVLKKDETVNVSFTYIP